MKIILALILMILAGCKSVNSSNPGNNIDSTGNPDYRPSGRFYVAPGTFYGTWAITDDSTIFPCTAILSETDSLLKGTIKNDSTNELLNLTGQHYYLPDIKGAYHSYRPKTVSSTGEIDDGGTFYFTQSTDSIIYVLFRKDDKQLVVICKRN
jgi:hypothetical protein